MLLASVSLFQLSWRTLSGRLPCSLQSLDSLVGRLHIMHQQIYQQAGLLRKDTEPYRRQCNSPRTT